jgi:hypothetical protein
MLGLLLDSRMANCIPSKFQPFPVHSFRISSRTSSDTVLTSTTLYSSMATLLPGRFNCDGFDGHSRPEPASVQGRRIAPPFSASPRKFQDYSKQRHIRRQDASKSPQIKSLHSLFTLLYNSRKFHLRPVFPTAIAMGTGLWVPPETASPPMFGKENVRGPNGRRISLSVGRSFSRPPHAPPDPDR